MFCALNGATRTPSCCSIRHRPVARMLLPTCDAVPANMSARVIAHPSGNERLPRNCGTTPHSRVLPCNAGSGHCRLVQTGLPISAGRKNLRNRLSGIWHCELRPVQFRRCPGALRQTSRLHSERFDGRIPSRRARRYGEDDAAITGQHRLWDSQGLKKRSRAYQEECIATESEAMSSGAVRSVRFPRRGSPQRFPRLKGAVAAEM